MRLSGSLLRDVFRKVAAAAEGFSDEKYRSFAVSLIVSSIIRVDDELLASMLGDVLSLAERVPDSAVRASALGELGLRIMRLDAGRAGEAFERALEALKDVSESERGEVFSKLAVRMVEAGIMHGDRGFIERVLENMSYADAFSRPVVTGAVLVGLRALGDEGVNGAFDMFLEVVRRLAIPKNCTSILIEVSRRLLAFGDRERAGALLEEALKWAKRGLRGEGDMLLMKVARALIHFARETGSLEHLRKAGRVAEEIGDSYRRAWVESEVANAMVDADWDGVSGVLDEAIRVARGIPEKAVKAWTLMDIALAVFERGLRGRAREMMEEAIEAARSIVTDKIRASVLKDIVVNLARLGGSMKDAGLLGEALNLAEEVRLDPGYYSFTIQNIIVETVKAEGVNSETLGKVFELLDRLDPSFQELTVCEILKYIEENARGKMEEALHGILEWVEKVKEGYYKACILERIAESYVSAGRISEAVALVRRAKATAEEIGEPRRSLVVGGCSRLLAKMAAMGERELWSEALKCLEGHAAISNRIYCEIQVAKEMFNAGMADMAEKVAGRVEREVDALDKPIPKYLLGRELALTLLEAGFKHGKRSLAARATALVRSASGVGKQAEFLQEIIERSIGIVKGGSGCSV